MNLTEERQLLILEMKQAIQLLNESEKYQSDHVVRTWTEICERNKAQKTLKQLFLAIRKQSIKLEKQNNL